MPYARASETCATSRGHRSRADDIRNAVRCGPLTNEDAEITNMTDQEMIDAPDELRVAVIIAWVCVGTWLFSR